MTDVENFVNAPGRDKLVKEVRKKINELGVTYIYFQFVSVTGRIMGKGAPADHWETFADVVSSWSTAPPRICSSIARTNTSLTVRRRGS